MIDKEISRTPISVGLTVLLGLFFVVGYYFVWLVSICWILAQFGYTFLGWDYIVPTCFIIVIHVLLGCFVVRTKNKSSE